MNRPIAHPDPLAARMIGGPYTTTSRLEFEVRLNEIVAALIVVRDRFARGEIVFENDDLQGTLRRIHGNLGVLASDEINVPLQVLEP